jgi:hypothetical protein
MKILSLVMLAVVLFAVPALAASSYLGGFSGLIYTPDTLTVPSQSLDLSFHDTFKFFGGQDFTAYGGIYGLSPSTEVGLSVFNNMNNSVALSGKFRLVDETADTPSVAIGVFDITNSATTLGGNPAGYLVISKDITAQVGEGTERRPLRLSLGAGSGIFNGIFASADYSFAPTWSAIVEFNGGHLDGQTNLFNGGVRWSALPGLRVDASFIGFQQLAIGGSYRLAIQ